LIVGASSVSSENILILAATGLTSKILTNTSSTSTAYLENGAYWYRYSGRSFGFAGNQSVHLNSVDVNSSNPTERLSWYYN
jgi:hypothetical protein